MLGCESLHDLDAPPVPVHVAEPARIHQDVKAELLARPEPAQHLIVLAAMPQPQIYNLAPPSLARDLHGLANLPVRMMAVFIEQRGRDLTSSDSSSSRSTIAFDAAIGSEPINSPAA